MTQEERHQHYYNEGYNAGCVKGYEQAIDKACEWVRDNWHKYINIDADGVVCFGHWENDFRKAMKGDAHPHWISVGEELPPRWEANPNVSVPVITCKYVDRELQDIDMQRYIFGDGKWQYGDATHWMPFQFPEKGGEE